MRAAGALAYRRRASPLHAARGPLAALYGAALALCALLTQSPILLGALLVGVLLAARGAGVGAAVGRAGLRGALPIVLASVLVNLLVSREGLTVWARLGEWGPLGQVDLTLEALLYGLVFGLRLLVVALACALAICAVDPDELLLAFRRFSPRSALTVSVATRLVPVLGQDARRLAEAQRCRGDWRARRGARERLVLLRATVGGALDRALDLAAVLEMRAYGAARGGAGRGEGGPARVGRASRSLSRHDLAFAGAAVALLALSLAAALAGIGRYQAYPLAHIQAGAPTWLLAALLVLLALLPFADRRGIER